ncbi:MAG: hypothetical protein ACFFEN_05550 [Candidatus Thorarchaeota archaeon]
MALPFIYIIILSILPFFALGFIIVWLIYEKYNIISGILIIVLISFMGFLIFPGLYLFWYGDIYYTLGCLIGLYIVFKHAKPDQTVVRTSLKVGIIGTAISSFLISIFQWSYSLYIFRFFNIALLGVYILNFAPFAIFNGILIGYFYGYYKRRRALAEESSLF